MKKAMRWDSREKLMKYLQIELVWGQLDSLSWPSMSRSDAHTLILKGITKGQSKECWRKKLWSGCVRVDNEL